MVGETVVDHIAAELGVPSYIIRQRNFFEPGQSTVFRNPVDDVPELLRACWNDLWKSSEFEARQAKVNNFNERNRYKKRGLAIIPTKRVSIYLPFSVNSI